MPKHQNISLSGDNISENTPFIDLETGEQYVLIRKKIIHDIEHWQLRSGGSGNIVTLSKIGIQLRFGTQISDSENHVTSLIRKLKSLVS